MLKKILLAGLILILFGPIPMKAQAIPSNPDDIIGVYYVKHQKEESRVRVSRDGDDTYSARVVWLKDSLDKNGNKRLDPKNPDKSLRGTPCDSIMILWGVSFNPETYEWSGGTVYDPTRGITAKPTLWFDESDGELRIKGSWGPIHETVLWKREQ